MKETSLRINGMSCGHCVASVERVLKALDGVETATVTVGAADVTYNPSRVTPDRIAGAVSDSGYATTLVGLA